MTFYEIHEVLDLACRHGYPVRVMVGGVPFDGWVWGSADSSSVVVCLGEARYALAWSEIEEATFWTPLTERMTGAWLREHL